MARPPIAYTEDELALLTDEEREGMLDETLGDDPEDAEDVDDDGEGEDQDGDTDVDADAKPDVQDSSADSDEDDDASDGDDEEEEDEDESGDDTDGEDYTGADVAAEADDAEDEEEEAGGDDEEDTLPTAREAFPLHQAPEGAKERIEAIEQEQAELATKMDDGEITAAEFTTQNQRLADERQDLRSELRDETASLERASSEWLEHTVPDFIAQHGELYDNPAMFAALDAHVRKLQDDTKVQFDPNHLATAHKRVVTEMRKALGIKDEGDKETDPKPDRSAKKGKSTAKDKTQKAAIPPNLGQLPAAEADDVDDGKFAHLDNLKGEAYEEALAKLTPAQLEEYEQSA